MDDIETDTGTTIPDLIATAQADLDIITGGDGVELATGQTAAWASAIEASARTIIEGTAEAGTLSVTQMTSNVTNADNSLIGRLIAFQPDTTTAALRGRITDITAFANATGIFTYTAIPAAPVNGDTFVVV